MKAEHEDGVSDDVEHRSGKKTDHAQGSLALIAEHIIHYERSNHHGAGSQDKEDIGSGVGGDCLRAPQQVDQGVDKDQAAHRYEDASNQGTKESGRGYAGRPVVILAAKHPGQDAAGSLAEHKSDSLYDGHKTEDDTDRPAGAGTQLADKCGVSHVINAGDQHADNGRNRQGHDQFMNRGLCHFFILCFSCIHNQSLSARIIILFFPLYRVFCYMELSRGKHPASVFIVNQLSGLCKR